MKRNAYNILNNMNLKRRSLTEYKAMTKKELIRSMISFIKSFDTTRRKHAELILECNYLHRKVGLLEDQLKFYKKYYLPKQGGKGIRVDSKK